MGKKERVVKKKRGRDRKENKCGFGGRELSEEGPSSVKWLGGKMSLGVQGTISWF